MLDRSSTDPLAPSTNKKRMLIAVGLLLKPLFTLLEPGINRLDRLATHRDRTPLRTLAPHLDLSLCKVIPANSLWMVGAIKLNQFRKPKA